MAELLHESNGLVGVPTPASAFTLCHGAALAARRGDGSCVGGMLAAIAARGWEAVPAVGEHALPSGPVVPELLEQVTAGILAAAEAAGPLDGVALALHGAMVGVASDDPEAELLARVRAVPSLRALPIIAGCDLHGNPSAALVDALDALCVYRRNPHDDIDATGARVIALLARLLVLPSRGACVRVPAGVRWEPAATATAEEPMAGLEAAARAWEARSDGLLEVAVFAGFPYARHDRTGVSICVSALPSQRALAHEAAEALARQAATATAPTPPATATLAEIDHALTTAPPGALVLAEPSDNIGAGTRGAATGGLQLLLERWGSTPSLATLCDPDTVAACAPVALGASLTRGIGGGPGAHETGPLAATWTLLRRSDGRFRLQDPQGPLAAFGGQAVDMGPCVVLGCRGLRVLVTSRPTPPWDLAQWTSQGIDPRHARLILVKSAVAHRRAYGPIAVRLLRLDTPGPCRLGPLA